MFTMIFKQNNIIRQFNTVKWKNLFYADSEFKKF